jgi:hypothetical protein
MAQKPAIEAAIQNELAQVGACTLEELIERLPYYSWNQVFAVVDRLSREGAVVLRRPDSLHYMISLVQHQSTEPQHVTAA